MELICDSGKLTEERTGGFRAHADHILSRHSPVFRTEQLEARRAVVADCLYRISNFLHRNGTQAGHQTVTVGTTMIYGLPICCATLQPKVNSSTSFSHSSGVQKRRTRSWCISTVT